MATLWRAGDTTGGSIVNATYQFWLAGPQQTAIFDECLYVLGCVNQGDAAHPLADENRVTVPEANLGPSLYATVSCGGVSEYKCPAAKGDANG